MGWPDHHTFQGDYVSILVFVELALDASVAFVARAEEKGFNPCFRGTCS